MGRVCPILVVTSPIPYMKLTCCVPGDDSNAVKRVSSLLRSIMSFPWVFSKVYMCLLFFLCAVVVILFIYVATPNRDSISFPPQCVYGYAVGLCGSGANVGVPDYDVAAINFVPCAILCVTTVGVLVYSCTELKIN